MSTAEALWERWQRENIAVVEREKGDKLSSLECSIALSLESGRMATDAASKRLLGVLCLLPDGVPVSVLFVILSPADAPAIHLQALARVSRWLKTPGVSESLLRARTRDEILEAVRAGQASTVAARG